MIHISFCVLCLATSSFVYLGAVAGSTRGPLVLAAAGAYSLQFIVTVLVMLILVSEEKAYTHFSFRYDTASG